MMCLNAPMASSSTCKQKVLFCYYSGILACLKHQQSLLNSAHFLITWNIFKVVSYILKGVYNTLLIVKQVTCVLSFNSVASIFPLTILRRGRSGRRLFESGWRGVYVLIWS